MVNDETLKILGVSEKDIAKRIILDREKQEKLEVEGNPRPSSLNTSENRGQFDERLGQVLSGCVPSSTAVPCEAGKNR